jgi:hypothetical protein
MSLFLLALVAAVASFIFGALWHMPLFGKIWARALGMDVPAKHDMKPMYGRMVINFIASYIMACIAFLFLFNFSAFTLVDSFMVFGVIFVGFVLPQQVTTNLWNGRPTKDAFKLFGNMGTLVYLASINDSLKKLPSG